MKFYLQSLTKNIILTATIIVAATSAGFGQISISDNNPQVTNFNGWAGTMPNGWTETGANYHGATASTTGGTYSIAGSGFGYQPSSTAPNSAVSVTATYQNNTGTTITSLSISYLAFNIVVRTSRLPAWAVSSTLGDVSSINWAFNSGSSATTPDSMGVVLTGLSIPDGTTFTLTFASDRGAGAGSSPLIGMNNVTVTNLTPTDPLFIRLNQFSAMNHGSTNELSWTTATENTGDVFEMERSTDGKTFDKIGTLNAKGFAPSAYSFTDQEPNSGANYYRLKLLNKDGSIYYSTIVSVNVTGSKPLAVIAYPNPMTDQLNITVTGSVSAPAAIALIDESGKTYYQQAVAQSGVITINTSSLISGTYFIRYSNGKEAKVIKVTK